MSTAITPAPVELPWYARVSATVGRPVVLLAALAMSAPGEYAMAIHAGWSPKVAWLMPVCVSVYAAVAAVIAATRPKGVSGRRSAVVGAGIALALALAAQVVAHLIASGHMATSAFLVAATSCVPPVVVAHMLHLAAVPKADTPDTATDTVATPPAIRPATTVTDIRDLATLVDTATEDDRAWDDALATLTDTPDTAPAKVDTPPVVTVAIPEEADTKADMAVADAVEVTTRTSTRGRSEEEIQAAVDYLRETGQEVTGQTYADYVGTISARTGRRDLRRVGITA